MKSLVLLASLFVVSRAAAQWAVIDAANLKQNVVQYAALVEQLSNQSTQISR